MKRYKFKEKIGIEFTFEDPASDYGTITNKKLTRAIDLLSNINTYKDVHKDDGVLEVPSMPFFYLEDALATYENITNKLAPLKLVPKHPRSTGGGTHLNVSYSGNTVFKKIYRNMGLRPYLTWFFQNPEDNQTSEPITGLSSIWGENPITGGEAISNEEGDLGNYIEFRIFGSAVNGIKDIENYLLFLDKFIRFSYRCRKIKIPNNEFKNYAEKYYLYKYNDTIKSFKNLLKTLGLSWRRYNNYEENYYWRREWAKPLDEVRKRW